MCFHLCPLPPVLPLSTTEESSSFFILSHQVFIHISKIFPVPSLCSTVVALSVSSHMKYALVSSLSSWPLAGLTPVNLYLSHTGESRTGASTEFRPTASKTKQNKTLISLYTQHCLSIEIFIVVKIFLLRLRDILVADSP